MNDERNSKTQLRAYLFGELEETAAEQLEERFFTEPIWLDALQAERDDLLDEWASGELSAVEAERLAARLAALPALREHAAFARSLRQHLFHEAEPQATVLPFRQRPSTPAFSAPRWRWALAAAAAVVLALSSFLVWNAWRSRTASAPTLANQSSPSPAAATGSPQVAQTREVPKAAVRQTPEHHVKEAGVASFVLATALVRSDTSTMELALPAPAKTLRLQLELPAGDLRPRQALLQSSAGTTVWQTSTLRPRSAGELRYVVCDVPAALLEAGAYQLRLTHANGVVTVYPIQLKKD